MPYRDVVVWDNSERVDAKTFGRYLALSEVSNDVVYFQDDDVLFTEHDALLAAYEPGRVTTNMPSPWFEECRYDEVGCLLVGAGALVPRGLPWEAFSRYLARWPCDDLFLDYCDFVHGILTPGRRLDLGYEVLPHASAPGRISTRPGADAKKWSVMNRALELR